MKIVVIGGTGLIGSNLIKKLKSLGHEAIAASPSTGVNTVTGDGLDEVLQGADIVVDVTNSPSFEDKAVLKFFETSTRNLLAAEKETGTRHHIILSIVGADLLPESGYLRAKVAQENLIKASSIPYTIVRSTQFFEFLKGIADSSATRESVHLPPAFLQPIASEDVALALLEVVLDPPINKTIEIAGPERFRLSELVGEYLKATGDPRKVISDKEARYFGTKLASDELAAHKNPRLGRISFKKWLDGQKK